ncbi:5-methyltetrahydropteroyltriglutamate--homocysteine methyltransferase [Dirofilaria immitis]
MSIFEEVRKLVDDANWRYRIHDGFDVRPIDTYKQIVSKAFFPVENIWKTASYCKLSEMYQPNLGEYRRSKSFSSLAPSNGMPYEDRNVQRYFGPFRSYIPKRSEWKFALEKYSKPKISQKHLLNIKTDINKAESEFNLVPTYRKLNKFPTSTSRLDNYNLYCRGRLHGVFGIGALFYPSNFIGEEDRRYERIYWGQDWMDYITPTARHATKLILISFANHIH